jgi:hypothetical protein
MAILSSRVLPPLAPLRAAVLPAALVVAWYATTRLSGGPGRCRPGLPRIRTCGSPASGSSGYGFAGNK